MKSIALFLLLGAAAHAAPYVFNLTGTASYANGTTPFAIGDTFTAQFTIDTEATDALPGDPAVGSYLLNTPSQIQFSNGLNLTGVPFAYTVVNDLYYSNLNATYDALAFYVHQPTFFLGFEIRFGTDTFSNDLAITPTLQTLVPQGIPQIPVPTNWYYWQQDSGGLAGGSMNTVTGETQAVPDSVSILGLLAVSFATLGLFRRRSAAQGTT